MANKITQDLYDGEIQIHHYPDSHRYRKEGERSYLISVTSISGLIDKSRFLIPWAIDTNFAYLLKYIEESSTRTFTEDELLVVIKEARREHESVKTKAGTLGDAVHDFCEDFAKAKIAGEEIDLGVMDELPAGAVNGINAFLDWYNENDVEFVGAEDIIYSRKYDYVGLRDALAYVGGSLAIVDYKTGSGIYNEARYQLSGYWQATDEERGYVAKKNGKKAEIVEQGIILNFDKDTGEMKDTLEVDIKEFEKDWEAFFGLSLAKRREKELQKEWYEKNKS